MITLTKLSGRYGAPMGRHSEGHLNNATTFAVEWLPFVDGCYDVGGAYWGSGTPLYCVAGFDENDEEVARKYVRAKNRPAAWAQVLKELDRELAPLMPETGSIVKQTIEFLQEYKAGLSMDDEQQVEELNDEISDLEGWLEEKGIAP